MGKIRVPEGMLTASIISVAYKGSAERAHVFIKSILEAALLWQRENPPAPTMEQALALRDLAIITSKGYDQVQPTAASETVVVVDWVRHMYDAPPEPEVVEFMECDICRAKPGSPTLCAGCLHNRVLINRFRAEKRESAPELEMPEEINNLRFTGNTTMSMGRMDRLLTEAYRRGQQTKTQVER